MNFSTDSDEQLMNAAAEGDLSTLDELLMRYQQRLLHFLSRLCDDPLVADTLFEKTFISIYRARRLYDPSIRFSTLLFGTAFSQANAWSKDNPITLQWAKGNSSWSDNPLSLEYRDGRIRRAMASLPLEQRAALHLSLFDNLSFFESGQCLQRSEAEVRVLFNRGWQKLRESLGPDFIQSSGS